MTFWLLNSTNYKVPQYALLFSMSSLPLCLIQIFLLVSCSQMLSMYGFICMRYQIPNPYITAKIQVKNIKDSEQMTATSH